MRTLALAVLLLLSGVPASAGVPAPRPPEVPLPPGVREITPADALALFQAGALAGILDIRTPDEAALTGHIPGAVFNDFYNAGFDEGVKALGWDTSRPCLVYCALGGRARRAASRLSRLGFKEIVILKGGFRAWKAAGLPVEIR